MNTIPFGKFREQPLDKLPVDYCCWMLDNASHWWVGENRAAIQAHVDAVRAEAVAAMPDYVLNEGQTLAVDTLAEWLEDDSTPCAKLEGGAGYGKSFALIELVKRAQAQGYSVTAAAPSYVAASVVDAQLSPLGVQTRTLARTLKMTVVYDGPVTDYVFSEDSIPELQKLLSNKHLLIIDEGFMCHDKVGRPVLEVAGRSLGKLLICGDTKQLPPVKQMAPSVFTSIELGCTLTQPMRYSVDSTLYALEQAARVGDVDWSQYVGAEVGVHGTVDDLIVQFVSDFRGNPTDDCRMMFFRRSDCVDANAHIRASLHGEESAYHATVDGEKLLVMSTRDVAGMDGGKKTRFYSSTTFNVTNVAQDEISYTALVNGRVHRLIFMVSETKADEKKHGGKEYNATLNELKEEALESGNWKAWREFQELFIPVGYGYAMTVHRCQGQSIDRAYFSRGIARSGAMGKPLFYVAATRARKTVHVC